MRPRAAEVIDNDAKLGLRAVAAAAATTSDEEPVRRHCRWLILFLSTVSGVEVHRAPTEAGAGESEPGFGAAIRRKLTQSKRSSLIIRLAYLVTTLRLCFYMYHQFAYDTQLMRLEYLQQINSTNEKLVKSMVAARDWHGQTLSQIGAPYKCVNRFAVAGLFMIVCISYTIYDQAWIYFSFLSPLDSNFLGSILDEANERRHCAQLVEQQVGLVLGSRSNYLRNLATSVLTTRRFYESRRLSERTIARYLEEATEESRKWLRAQLLSSGHLQPVNRSAAWVRAMADNFMHSCVAVVAFCLTYMISLYVVGPLAARLPLQTSWLDLVALGEILFANGILVLTLAFYLSLFIVVGLDQASYIRHTRQQIVECMRSNKRTFDSCPDTGHASRLVEQINWRLLVALLRYKILLAQSKPNQSLFKFLAFIAIMASLLPPIVVRFISTYLDPTLRLLGLLFCLVCSAFSMLALVPIGNLNQLATRLCAALFCLHAHAAEMVEHLDEECKQQLDWHTVALVCKELRNPELLADKFATKIGRTPITYPNIIKTLFWCSILLFSCFFDTQMLRNLFGGRLDDPLHIFEGLS